MSCECTYWETTNLNHMLLTGHHESCPHSPPFLDAALDLIARLAGGMEAWASDEDGIHYQAWEAYRLAKMLEGVFLPEPEGKP